MKYTQRYVEQGFQFVTLGSDSGWMTRGAFKDLREIREGTEALQATALHELGHAFGLWGHSPDPADAMAPFQPADPTLILSAVDRRTLQWVRRQANQFGAMPPDDQSRLGASRREARTD